jgi:hypothetical protein
VPTQKDALKERLTRYREIKISVIDRKSGRQSRFRSGSCWKARRRISFRCMVRTPSGIAMCSRIRLCGLMREAQRRRGGTPGTTHH